MGQSSIFLWPFWIAMLLTRGYWFLTHSHISFPTIHLGSQFCFTSDDDVPFSSSSSSSSIFFLFYCWLSLEVHDQKTKGHCEYPSIVLMEGEVTVPIRWDKSLADHHGSFNGHSGHQKKKTNGDHTGYILFP